MDARQKSWMCRFPNLRNHYRKRSKNQEVLSAEARLPRQDTAASPSRRRAQNVRLLIRRLVRLSTRNSTLREAIMKHVTPYQAKSFDLHGLTGISDRTLDMHFKLYAGYVKETNTLTDRIRDVLKDGKVDQDEMPAYSELKRRLGFEYNGMVLHEYYFENMKKGGAGDPGRNSPFIQAAEESFG